MERVAHLRIVHYLPQILSNGIVQVDDCHGFLLDGRRYDPGEEMLLALPILVETGMIVEVILTEIGKDPHIEMAVNDPTQIERMG